MARKNRIVAITALIMCLLGCTSDRIESNEQQSQQITPILEEAEHFFSVIVLLLEKDRVVYQITMSDGTVHQGEYKTHHGQAPQLQVNVACLDGCFYFADPEWMAGKKGRVLLSTLIAHLEELKSVIIALAGLSHMCPEPLGHRKRCY